MRTVEECRIEAWSHKEAQIIIVTYDSLGLPKRYSWRIVHTGGGGVVSKPKITFDSPETAANEAVKFLEGVKNA